MISLIIKYRALNGLVSRYRVKDYWLYFAWLSSFDQLMLTIDLYI